MKTIKNKISILAAAILTVIATAGCGQNSSENSQAPASSSNGQPAPAATNSGGEMAPATASAVNTNNPAVTN